MNILELKKIRNKYNLKREDLADKLEMSLETLNTWEYRDKKIPEDKVDFIKSVFSMYFISDLDQKKEAPFEELPIDSKLNMLYGLIIDQNKKIDDLAEQNEEIKQKQKDNLFVLQSEIESIITELDIQIDDKLKLEIDRIVNLN